MGSRLPLLFIPVSLLLEATTALVSEPLFYVPSWQEYTKARQTSFLRLLYANRPLNKLQFITKKSNALICKSWRLLQAKLSYRIVSNRPLLLNWSTFFSTPLATHHALKLGWVALQLCQGKQGKLTEGRERRGDVLVILQGKGMFWLDDTELRTTLLAYYYFLCIWVSLSQVLGKLVKYTHVKVCWGFIQNPVS